MSALRVPAMMLIVALAVVLAGCGQVGADAAAQGGVTGAWLAMARGEIDVEGGLVRITTPRDGRIDTVQAEDGDAVAQGAVLATLDQREARTALALAEAALRQARAQLEVARARLAPLGQLAQRTGEAAAAGATSAQAADEANTNLAVLKAEVAAAEAAVAMAHERVNEARSELELRVLRAPVAGRIVRRGVHVGDVVSVQGGAELFQLLPDRPRIVRAELNEAYVDKVNAGMQADVVRESGEGATVQAQVLRVGEVFGPSRLTDDPIERAGVHDVDCVLRLEGGDFRIGQRVLVKFRAGQAAPAAPGR